MSDFVLGTLPALKVDGETGCCSAFREMKQIIIEFYRLFESASVYNLLRGSTDVAAKAARQDKHRGIP